MTPFDHLQPAVGTWRRPGVPPGPAAAARAARRVVTTLSGRAMQSSVLESYQVEKPNKHSRAALSRERATTMVILLSL